MSFSAEQVRKATLRYYENDALAADVWMSKYALKDKKGEFKELSPLDMYDRITREIIRIERKLYDNPLKFEDVYDMLQYKYFTFAGSVLFGLGNNYQLTSLGNCYVIGNEEDSYSGIMQMDTELIQLSKRRAGVGLDLSHLRPANAQVNNAALTSTGSISFMDRYSNSIREVSQNGRRGALILTLNINHPDIQKFIVAKNDLTKITGANISVKITDDFMEAVEDDKEYNLTFNDIVIPVKAKKIWDSLIHQAWKNAEPGVLFWDRIIEENPADCYDDFKTKSVNPCGEVTLSPYDSCRLGSMVLSSFVDNPFTESARFNFTKFRIYVDIAQQLMDDLIDLENEKIEAILAKIDSEEKSVNSLEKDLWVKIRKSLLNGRRTGLGLFGLADVFAMMNIRYGSEMSIALTEKIAKTMAVESYKSSFRLAKSRGHFPVWNKEAEKENPFVNRILSEIEEKDDYESLHNYNKYGRRNIANLSIAPTGSLAIIFQTSSGMEPLFNTHYIRRRKVEPDHPNKSFKDDTGDWWEEYTVMHHTFKQWIETASKASVSANEMSDEDVKAWEEKSPYNESTANDIDPLQKIKLQSKLQMYIDHSISCTYNVPSTITESEVSELYYQAWLYGLKGFTLYREGSRAGVLINTKKTIPEIDFGYRDAPKRPKILPCEIATVKVQGEQFVVVVGLYEKKPYEVFAFKFDNKFSLKNGLIVKATKGRYNILTEQKETYAEDITSDMSPMEEDRTRLISTALRHGADIKFIVEQLSKSKSDITSFSKAIARTLNTYITTPIMVTDKCPECKSELSYEGGCISCKQCGYTQCN